MHPRQTTALFTVAQPRPLTRQLGIVRGNDERAINHIHTLTNEATLTTFLTQLPPVDDDDVLLEWDFASLPPESCQSVRRVRFLVTSEGTIRLGRDGRPHQYIPAHAQLLFSGETAIATGDYYFAKINERWRLVGASNKSGDFKPDIQSLQFGLHYVTQMGIIPYASIFQIEVQGASWLKKFSEVFKLTSEQLNTYLTKLNVYLASAGVAAASSRECLFIEVPLASIKKASEEEAPFTVAPPLLKHPEEEGLGAKRPKPLFPPQSPRSPVAASRHVSAPFSATPTPQPFARLQPVARPQQPNALFNHVGLRERLAAAAMANPGPNARAGEADADRDEVPVQPGRRPLF